MELPPVVDEREDALGREDISQVSEALVSQSRAVEGLVEESFV